jgi:hypothetical protein
MNMLILLTFVLVAFCYFGGKHCPKVLKDNKKILLGVFVGLTICSFMDLKLEKFDNAQQCLNACQDNGIWGAPTGLKMLTDDLDTVDRLCSAKASFVSLYNGNGENNKCIMDPDHQWNGLAGIGTSLGG